MSLVDFKVLEYRQSGNMVIADSALKEKMAKFSSRELMRRTGLSQHTLDPWL